MAETPIKERPILFNGEMVRAVLDGRKTQTRRVAKLTDTGRVKAPGSSKNWHLDDPDSVLACPYGQPGDELWVRETWAWTEYAQHRDEVVWRADVPAEDRKLEAMLSKYSVNKWRPSIHMPRWASRIQLRINSVRVERLQDIGEEDAKAEGVRIPSTSGGRPLLNLNKRVDSHPLWGGARERLTYVDWWTGYFALLWNSINADRGFGWDVNPWVWVVEFERIEQ